MNFCHGNGKCYREPLLAEAPIHRKPSEIDRGDEGATVIYTLMAVGPMRFR
jgi:hypothetical protein